jgi:glycogen debranching enzyme
MPTTAPPRTEPRSRSRPFRARSKPARRDNARIGGSKARRARAAAQAQLALTRETCGDLAVAARREWLVTNGIGGYAAGTVATLTARRYHGLLVAALTPPLGRRVLFAKLDARITYAGRSYDLDTTRWHDGTVAPAGYANIETFALDGTVPVWTYRCADACIERRVWMDRGRNATYVTFAVHAAAQTLSFEADVFAVDRDYHATMRAFAAGDATTVDANHARIVLAAGTPWYLHVAGATIEAASGWYCRSRPNADSTTAKTSTTPRGCAPSCAPATRSRS